ncbi:sigma-54 interaction domain-containing protein [Brevibacillus marinus]|uniref:sigma-54 interaction domain-containing protein n=1 Tax=Brevibacillus marinus TaxID=2496837 RepID=UPI000F82C7A8|nr:sigma 54-interacting transcriptional regulator [Brevibacillus marinus]
MVETIDQRRLLKIYEYILDELNEGVHVIDRNGKSIIYNRKMTEIEGMSKEAVLNKSILEVFHFPDNEESTMMQALERGVVTKNVKQTYFNDKGKEITTVTHTFPIFDGEEIIGAIEIANDITKMEQILRGNMLKGDARITFDEIIGQNPLFREVMEHAKRASRTSSSVLIIGETGTGKELFAQSIHNASSRAHEPFIAQNCAALPESLIEGILFGTRRGAFTGAIERPGLFELANKGTLLLDEINSLSLNLQAKLLRVLQEKKVRRLGDTKDIDVDVRIIATINEDPIDAINANRLRKDLYYRLSVVALYVPPLRERKDDIPLLGQKFINKYNRLFQMSVQSISAEVLRCFYAYDWPGNVRELEHVIEGAMNMMADEREIAFSHLPYQFRRKSQWKDEAQAVSLLAEQWERTNEPKKQDLKSVMAEFEQYYLNKVLQRYQGNVSKAACELGISRQSLQYRIRKHALRARHDV